MGLVVQEHGATLKALVDAKDMQGAARLTDSHAWEGRVTVVRHPEAEGAHGQREQPGGREALEVVPYNAGRRTVVHGQRQHAAGALDLGEAEAPRGAEEADGSSQHVLYGHGDCVEAVGYGEAAAGELQGIGGGGQVGGDGAGDHAGAVVGGLWSTRKRPAV